MRAATLVLLLAAPLAAQQGSVQGVVLDRSNGRPLSGVHVRVFPGETLQSATASYGAMSDPEGRFSIAAIPPGSYTVELERAGFVQVPGDGFMRHTEIEIRPDQDVTGRQLAMSPLALVAGRIVNQNGDPVPGARVQLTTGSRTSYDAVGPFSQRTADERGQFRLFAAPGKYYFLAEPPISVSSLGPAEIRIDGTSDFAYSATYFPGSMDLASAAMLEFKPGNETAPIELKMLSGAPRRNLSVSGIVTGVPAGAQATVAFMYGPSPGQYNMGNTGGRVGIDGRFSFDNLAPGYLRLLARCSSGNTELQSDIVDIRLEPPGATDIRLALTPGGIVTGALEVVGDGSGSAAAPAGKLSVRLSPSSGLGFSQPGPGGLLSGPVDENGAFRIAGVTPGRFSVGVDPMPENAYIKAVLLNDVAAKDGTLDLSGGVRGPVVKVTVSRNGAQISGQVRAADGGPVLNSRVSVFLVPEPGLVTSQRGVQIVDGKYLFKNVPPGKYKVYAADLMQIAGAAQTRSGADPRTWFLATAETVEIAEGSRLTKDLKTLSREDINAQSGK